MLGVVSEFSGNNHRQPTLITKRITHNDIIHIFSIVKQRQYWMSHKEEQQNQAPEI
jgi:hypothetical protein